MLRFQAQQNLCKSTVDVGGPYSTIGEKEDWRVMIRGLMSRIGVLEKVLCRGKAEGKVGKDNDRQKGEQREREGEGYTDHRADVDVDSKEDDIERPSKRSKSI
jgi:hypothetical protein